MPTPSPVTCTDADWTLVIQPHSRLFDLKLNELWHYRDLIALFVRRDFAWFGLIGSASKRAGFNRRFTARGLPPMRLGDLTCPIGIAGIQSKHPAAIAAAVAAQLLQVREARSAIQHASHPGPDAPPLSSLPRPQ